MTDEQHTKDRIALRVYLDAERLAAERRNAVFSESRVTPRGVAHEAWEKYRAEDDAAFDAFVSAVLANHKPEPQVGPRISEGEDGDAD